jgi:hypothetical protein
MPIIPACRAYNWIEAWTSFLKEQRERVSLVDRLHVRLILQSPEMYFRASRQRTCLVEKPGQLLNHSALPGKTPGQGLAGKAAAQKDHPRSFYAHFPSLQP